MPKYLPANPLGDEALAKWAQHVLHEKEKSTPEVCNEGIMTFGSRVSVIDASPSFLGSQTGRQISASLVESFCVGLFFKSAYKESRQD